MLNPRDSGSFIASRSEHVKIDHNKVEEVGKMIFDTLLLGDFYDSDFSSHELHPKSKDKRAVDWVFFMDVINFSFWSDEEDGHFFVTYNNKIYSGYFAACACVNRALDNGIPLICAFYMAEITAEMLSKILRTDSGVPFPLIKERVQALNEAGRVLLQKFNGSFFNCIEQSDNSALKLLDIITQNFSSFRDYSIYESKPVSLLKRAQILVADIFSCQQGLELVNFPDISQLTMFADYRLPQILAYLQVFRYSDKLMNLLDKKCAIQFGCQYELELRGCSIEACERIVQVVARLRTESGKKNSIRIITAMDVDMFLWTYRRKIAKQVEVVVPFHRIRMFKKFNANEDISGTQQLKSSVQKSIRNKLLEQFPLLIDYLNNILPKKESFKQVKCRDHLEMITDSNGLVLFIKPRDGQYIPTLRLLHQYPFMLPHQRVDKGAIKFVLKGSQIMCPGLTSDGAKLTDGIDKDTLVAIMAEGKKHALAVGMMKLSSDDIRTINKGVGIDNVHYLDDGLWNVGTVI